MTGTIALQGGGPFVANDDLDRALLAAASATEVVVLPTADAFAHPQRLVDAATSWAARIGVSVRPLMVLRRGEAVDDANADVVRGARAVYLVGDQPLHLRSVLKDTPIFAALRDVLAHGGVVVATGGSASALCDPMVDPRGGAFTLGLGMVGGLAVVTEAEQWSPERMHRTRALANTSIAFLRTGDALVHDASGWRTVGSAEVHGDLPG